MYSSKLHTTNKNKKTLCEKGTFMKTKTKRMVTLCGIVEFYRLQC